MRKTGKKTQEDGAGKISSNSPTHGATHKTELVFLSDISFLWLDEMLKEAQGHGRKSLSQGQCFLSQYFLIDNNNTVTQ